MTDADFKMEAGRLRSQTQKLLNDVFIWTDAAAKALKERTSDDVFVGKERFVVPSMNPSKEVKRTPEEIQSLLTSAFQSDIFGAVIVYIVAHVESFLYALAKKRLLSDPRRLKIKVPGIDHLNKIETAAIVDSVDRMDLLERIISRELQAVFYARPSAYFEYFERAIGFKLDEDVAADWVEIKATRDLVVHNSGVVNEIYLEKAGKKARDKISDKISIDPKYFGHVVTVGKRVVGQAVSRATSKGTKTGATSLGAPSPKP